MKLLEKFKTGSQHDPLHTSLTALRLLTDVNPREFVSQYNDYSRRYVHRELVSVAKVATRTAVEMGIVNAITKGKPRAILLTGIGVFEVFNAGKHMLEVQKEFRERSKVNHKRRSRSAWFNGFS